MGLRTQQIICLAAFLCILGECRWTRLQAWQTERSIEQHQFSPPDIKRAVHLPYAQFQIPFNIDHSGATPTSVQLYVSTDGGATWQLHGRQASTAKHFDFRAAAEGEYLFTVQTVDSTGVAFPSPHPPLRVLVDTTRPQTSIQADLDHHGNLIVDLKASDPNLDIQSATLRVRTDRDSSWREVAIDQLGTEENHLEGQVELILPPCREVLMIFSVMDHAKNNSEVSFRFAMPRTAVGPSDMQLASNRPGTNHLGQDPKATGGSDANLPVATNASSFVQTGSLPGAIAWDADAERRMKTNANPPSAVTDKSGNAGLLNAPPLAQHSPGPTRSAVDRENGPGRLTGGRVDLQMMPSHLSGEAEEIPPPQAESPPQNQELLRLDLEEPSLQLEGHPRQNAGANPRQAVERDEMPSSEIVDSRDPYYCKSRTFSLDYSVEALGGNLLSEVELWGTEDSGVTWEKWGTDPDRITPFDVRVGNDGLFGFRMVIVGQSGYVLGQPRSGDPADVWIFVDTELPSCKITRAVYGEGSEAGMLVIDYSCWDSQLTEYPITISYSVGPDGPWTTVASGLKNSGLYLWKVEPNVPDRVYLKLEAVDKAGNTGVHRMDLPINIKGLSPRGRIQGFRPIIEPN